MLHGDIRVNHTEIARWTAVRLSPDVTTPSDYRVEVSIRGLDGYVRIAKFTLYNHEYGHGALALAARILQEAIPHLRLPTPEE